MCGIRLELCVGVTDIALLLIFNMQRIYKASIHVCAVRRVGGDWLAGDDLEAEEYLCACVRVCALTCMYIYCIMYIVYLTVHHYHSALSLTIPSFSPPLSMPRDE